MNNSPCHATPFLLKQTKYFAQVLRERPQNLHKQHRRYEDPVGRDSDMNEIC